MDDGQKEVIRTALEMQFRYKFYQDTTFPYLQSLGIKDVFQGFGNNETGFIGMLHLWWVPEESNVHFDSPKKFPIKIKGFWKAEWFDTLEERLFVANKVEDERPYNTSSIIDVHVKYNQELKEIRMQEQFEDNNVILN